MRVEKRSAQWMLPALFVLQCVCLSAEAEPVNLIETRIRTFLDVPELKQADVGVLFTRLSDKKAVVSMNADTSLIVASNNKLVTTAAALHQLGKDFTFSTLLWTDGRVERDGALKGNLIVRSNGDPFISGRFHPKPTSVFEAWADQLKRKGVKHVVGDVIADDTAFDREWVNPQWPRDQLTFWYCAQISALTFNDNCLDYTIKPGSRVGVALRASVSPDTRYQVIRNTSKTSSRRARSAIWFTRANGGNRVSVGGSHPIGGAPFTESITVHNPALYFSQVMKETFARQGVVISGIARLADGPRDPAKGGRKIADHSSPLLDTLRVTNKRSQNLFAEILLKTMGHAKYGKGSRANGLKAVGAFLSDAGVVGDYKMADGSGLARGNQFSAEQLVKILVWMADSDLGADYRASLAVAGIDGTLKERHSSSALKGNVFAKTGYISKVSALSGYLNARSGELYAFSILMNGFKGSNVRMKRIQDDVCLSVYEGG